MKLDVVNYLEHKTVCKICNIRGRRKNSNNTVHDNQKSKLLTTITLTIEPQSSSDEVLELLEVLEPRIPRSYRTWNS